MHDIFCSKYKDSYDLTGSKVGAIDVLSAIQEGEVESLIQRIRRETDDKIVDKLKKNLPSVCFSGLFSIREDDKLENYTNLIVIDIDDKDPSTIRSLKKKLVKDKTVVSFFDSPRMGLKVISYVDTPAEMHKVYAYRHMEAYYRDSYKVSIDPKCKNISRLCYLSYDPDLHYRDDFEVVRIDIKAVDRTIKKMKPKAVVNKDFLINGAGEVFDICVKITRASQAGSYHKGNRNNYLFCLACNLNRAGMDCEMALSLVWNRYNSLDFKEVSAAVNSAYRHNAADFGSRPIQGRRKNKQIGLF